MAARKIAISVPEDVLDEVDRAAAARATTRSAFITDVLRAVAKSRREADVARRIRAFFEDPDVELGEQGTARTLSAAAAKMPDWEW